jgi:hypothetical protein
VLGGDAPPLVLAQEGAVGDAQQGVVRAVGLGGGEIDVVGRDQRNVMLISVGDQAGLRARFDRQAMALQFDIEAIAERPLHLSQRAPRLRRAARRQQRIDRAVRPT